MGEILFIGLIAAVAFIGGGISGFSSKEEAWIKDCNKHGVHISTDGEMYKCEKVK